ncbi:MAG: cation transporter [Blastocatellia bacterium]|nr:cation transporter [Blastocatellia bacterium]
MKDKAVLGGAIASAVAASLCCIGPLLAVVLGLGAFGAGAIFEALRPYLIGVTALLLAGAFYLTYRKREVRCEDGKCKADGPSRTSKIILWLATIVVIAFAAFPYYSGALLKAQTQTSAPATNRSSSGDIANPSEASAIVMISGMTCGSCAFSVQSVLAKVPGVKSADVSYEKGQAVVVYDPTAIGLDAIRSAIDSTGFKATEARVITDVKR